VTRLKESILAAIERGDREALERLRAQYRRVAVIERPVLVEESDRD
jgi:hypothetical protein